MNFSLIRTAIFTGFSLSSSLALATDSAVIKTFLDAQSEARSRYYQECRKLDSPTPDELSRLHSKRITPSQENLLTTFSMLKQKDAEEQRESLEKQHHQFVEKLSKSIVNNPNLTDELKKKGQESLKMAQKGRTADLIKMGNELSKKYPGEKGPKKPAHAAPPLREQPRHDFILPREDIILDGSQIPKELEFPVPKTQSN